MGRKRKSTVAAPEKVVLSTGVAEFATRYYWAVAAILLAGIAFFCFYQLGQLPVRDWDEARHGVSAYEMMKNGNLIVNTYQYAPDYWNLKPPMSFWGVTLGYKLFGFEVLGLRFYSALAFVLTAAVIAVFAKWRYGSLESLLILLIFLCSSPYYRFHFARHGDADSLFSLFMVLSILAALLVEERPWALPVCSGAFALAFLTRSWHALIIVAVVGVIFLRRGILRRLSWKQWTLFLAAGAVPILLWMAVRYAYDGTHFFTEMVRVDLLNRTTQVLENHGGGITAYLGWLLQLSLVTGLLPICLILFYLPFAFPVKALFQKTPH